MRRRDFLLDLARYAVLCAGVPNLWRVTGRPVLPDDPFRLGVASGDPTPTGATLWTRLAPRLGEPEGGMEGQRTAVRWEVADDERFAHVVQAGRATAVPELGHSLHVDVSGLEPDRWYFYRFTLAAGASPVGRLRTTPAAGGATPLRFAFASCQHYEDGFYTAYDHMAEEDLDLVVHLGDYIYEYGGRDGRVRRYPTAEALTLDQYRARYAQTKSDALLQRAHARAPWVITWDDHEVDNDYAGLHEENGMESEEQVHQRRAAAYQAWWEHQPVRVPRAASWGDLAIARTIDWGTLARFWVLDTRQYRSPQPCEDQWGVVVPCGTWADTTHTMMGPAQERWLDTGLGASAARWQVLANQVMVAPFDLAPGPPRGLSMDQWSGYPAALERLMATIGRRAPNRTVVITGDIHSNWVNELRSDYQRPGAPVIGAEFVGTSISSGGDGRDTSDYYDRSKGDNPHCRWNNARRGYVTCAVDGDDWRTRFRTVPYISRPGAPVETASEWALRRGRPGPERV